MQPGSQKHLRCDRIVPVIVVKTDSEAGFSTTESHVLPMTSRPNAPDRAGTASDRSKLKPASNAYLNAWSSIRAFDGSWKARRNAQAALQRSASERAEQKSALDRLDNAHGNQPLVDLLAMGRQDP